MSTPLKPQHHKGMQALEKSHCPVSLWIKVRERTDGKPIDHSGPDSAVKFLGIIWLGKTCIVSEAVIDKISLSNP